MESGRGKGLHGTERSVCEGAAEPFCCVAALVKMMVVKERVELRMERLDLRLRSTSEEAIALSEVEGVAQHVKLRESILSSLSAPVLLDIIDCCASPRSPSLPTRACAANDRAASAASGRGWSEPPL